MNTRELLKQAARELREAGVPDPEYDSAVLLSRVMDVPPLQLRLGFTEPTEEQLNRFRELMNRRLKREPLQYIEGKAVFHRQEYAVRPGALIPRPETEGRRGGSVCRPPGMRSRFPGCGCWTSAAEAAASASA